MPSVAVLSQSTVSCLGAAVTQSCLRHQVLHQAAASQKPGVTCCWRLLWPMPFNSSCSCSNRSVDSCNPGSITQAARPWMLTRA
jgi:hypothetical protein